MDEFQSAVLARLAMIEETLATLVRYLAEEDDGEPPELTLDGRPAGGKRDTGESLG